MLSAPVSSASAAPPARRLVHALAPGWPPPQVAAALWRGDQLGSSVSVTLSSGFAPLDAQLPGGGWPSGALTEILCSHCGALEWRLLGPALRQVCALGRCVVVVAPPWAPHPPGLCRGGLGERHLVWVQAQAAAERLWSTEQLIKANAFGALLVWLPRVRAAQVRRLQVLAARCDAPVFLCRPASAAAESSAAPLRLLVRAGMDWQLHVDIIKRKGPPLERTLLLPSVPGGLAAVLTPRLRTPSALRAPRGSGDVVVSPAAPQREQSLAH